MSSSSLDQKLAQFLRAKRGESTYTQFSRKVGLRESTLFRIENGQQSATLRAVQQILKRLHCSYADIFAFSAARSRVADSSKSPALKAKTAGSKVSYRKSRKKRRS